MEGEQQRALYRPPCFCSDSAEIDSLALVWPLFVVVVKEL